ncbi:hypothetical protein GCM10008967_04670 [Bacillus carboniphilus]|uniref:Uncharacterized protein n=1 Tax=Bacillus carboniphilus TaxID=86663 RepID=A0ABN0VTU5_9BACI
MTWPIIAQDMVLLTKHRDHIIPCRHVEAKTVNKQDGFSVRIGMLDEFIMCAV